MPAPAVPRLRGDLRRADRALRLRGAEAAVAPTARGSGEKMAFAITEPDAGSNTHRLSTTAVRDGDTYRLRGTKTYISGVDEAAAVLVVARTASHRRGRPATPGSRCSSSTATRPGSIAR